MSCIGRKLTESEFEEYLKTYQSTDASGVGNEEGLTLTGFKHFFIQEFRSAITLHSGTTHAGGYAQAEELMYMWLENLGYDKQLYSIRSRLFNLVFHSDEEIEIDVRDAVGTDLDSRVNLLVMEKFGQE